MLLLSLFALCVTLALLSVLLVMGQRWDPKPSVKFTLNELVCFRAVFFMGRKKVEGLGLTQPTLQVRYPQREAALAMWHPWMMPGATPPGLAAPPFWGDAMPPGASPAWNGATFGAGAPPMQPGMPAPGGWPGGPQMQPPPPPHPSTGFEHPAPAALEQAAPATPKALNPTARHHAAGRAPQDDDHQKLSTSFRSLGCAWKHPVNRVTPRKFRQSLLAACCPIDWSAGRTSQFTEDQIDMVLFALAGINPNTGTQDFGSKTKGDLRDQVYQQHRRVMRQNPQRVQMLAENLENLMPLVLRLGYPVDAFSPHLYQQYQQTVPSALTAPQVPALTAAAPQVPALTGPDPSGSPASTQRRIEDGSVTSDRASAREEARRSRIAAAAALNARVASALAQRNPVERPTGTVAPEVGVPEAAPVVVAPLAALDAPAAEAAAPPAAPPSMAVTFDLPALNPALLRRKAKVPSEPSASVSTTAASAELGGGGGVDSAKRALVEDGGLDMSDDEEDEPPAKQPRVLDVD